MSQPAEGSHVPPWLDIVDRQSGVIARRQLIELGLPPGLGRSRIGAGHWRRLMPGVYATSPDLCL
jgi:hypothetical protein